VFLVWVIIGRVMPFFGLELLGMARDVADFNLLRRIMAPGRREKLRELLLTALTTDDVTKHSLALCAYTALGSLDWGEYTELANSATYANALDRFKEDELRPKFKKYRGIRDKLQTVEDIATELKTVYAALCGAIEKLKRKGENGKALSAQTGDVYMVGPTATGSVSTVFAYRPRIYIHAPYRPAPAQADTKNRILEKIRELGFDPQEFHVSGVPKGDSWSFDRAIEVMLQCGSALILALMRWTGLDGTRLPSEYSHFEGALALSCNLPTLVIAEEGMQMRGILSQMGGSFVLRVPIGNTTIGVAADEVLTEPPFQKWVERVNARYDVFFGYCSKANELAQNLKRFLVDESGLRVLDWATDFRPGRTIMEEVARAAATCRCGCFFLRRMIP
jgi:hypothetical protein